MIYNVDSLDRPSYLDIVVKDDIMDVCIDDRRTLVLRVPDIDGNRLFLFAQNADIVFNSIKVKELT